MSYDDFRNTMIAFNAEHGYTSKGNPKKLKGKIVFKASNWPKTEYTEAERTYITDSDQKGFGLGCCSNSIFASCLAPYTDQGVRLDWYMQPYVPDGWEVERCEIIGEGR